MAQSRARTSRNTRYVPTAISTNPWWKRKSPRFSPPSVKTLSDRLLIPLESDLLYSAQAILPAAAHVQEQKGILPDKSLSNK
jgi:hypothetical protein